MKYRIDRSKGWKSLFVRRLWMVRMILSRRHVLVVALEDVRKWEDPAASMGWSNFKDEGAVELAMQSLNEMSHREKLDTEIDQLTGESHG